MVALIFAGFLFSNIAHAGTFPDQLKENPKLTCYLFPNLEVEESQYTEESLSAYEDYVAEVQAADDYNEYFRVSWGSLWDTDVREFRDGVDFRPIRRESLEYFLPDRVVKVKLQRKGKRDLMLEVWGQKTASTSAFMYANSTFKIGQNVQFGMAFFDNSYSNGPKSVRQLQIKCHF